MRQVSGAETAPRLGLGVRSVLSRVRERARTGVPAPTLTRVPGLALTGIPALALTRVLRLALTRALGLALTRALVRAGPRPAAPVAGTVRGAHRHPAVCSRYGPAQQAGPR